MVRELVRFKVNGLVVRLTAPPGHQVLKDYTWNNVTLETLKGLIGVEANDAMTSAVIEAVGLHRGNAEKIKEHFLSVLRRPTYKELGFVDLSTTN